MMVRFTKKLAAAIFLGLFLAAAIVSCGKKGSTEAGGEQAADSTEHPSDSSAHEHPADSAGQEHPHEHPSDSTAN